MKWGTFEAEGYHTLSGLEGPALHLTLESPNNVQVTCTCSPLQGLPQLDSFGIGSSIF